MITVTLLLYAWLFKVPLCQSIVFEVSPPIKGIQEKSFMAFDMLSTL